MPGYIIFIIISLIVIVLACIIHALYSEPIDFHDWLTEEHGIPLIFGLLSLAVVIYLFIFVSWKIMLIIVSSLIVVGIIALTIYFIIKKNSKEYKYIHSKLFNELNFLNKRIYDVSFKRYRDGYYADSVEVAIKEIITRVKKLVKKYKNKDLKELDAFEVIFNDNLNETVLIAGNDLVSKSGISEQEGYRYMLKGLWKSLRNPDAHENKSMTKEQAVERLYFASLIMRKIDECVKKANLTE